MSIPVKVYIQSKDLEELIDFYETKLLSVKQQRKDLDLSEREIRATLMQLRSKLSDLTAPEDNSIKYSIQPNLSSYSRTWQWVQKIEFAIREGGKPLTTTEIIEMLIVVEPALEDEKRKSISSVSAIVSMQSGTIDDKNKKFVKITDTIGKSRYYLHEEVLSENKSETDLPF